MAQPGTGEVLMILDERRATGIYWRLILLATVGGFLFGRKWLLITDAPLYAARTVLSAVTPDIAELAPKNRHRSLALLQHWMVIAGTTVACLIALVIFRSAPDPALHH